MSSPIALAQESAMAGTVDAPVGAPGTAEERTSEEPSAPDRPASVPDDNSTEQSDEATPHVEDDPSAEPEGTESDVEPSDPEPFDAEAFSVAPMQVGEGCTYSAEGAAGAYADTLCWLDFSSVQTQDGRSVELTTEYRDRGLFANPRRVSVLDPEGGPFTHTAGNTDRVGGLITGTHYGDRRNLRVEVELRGGYKLDALLDISGRNNPGTTTLPARARHIESSSFPTWEGAFLGNNGFYELPDDSNAEPALYQQTDGGGQATTQVRLHDISLTRNGEQVHDFSIVVADAESTDRNERIAWSTTGQGFEWLPNTPGAVTKQGTMGDACRQQISPSIGGKSTSASCIAGSNQPDGIRSGTPMLHTSPSQGRSFEVTQTMTGNGLQGVSFGLITAQAQVNVEVADRVLDSEGHPVIAEAFEASLHLEDRTETVNTGNQQYASTGQQPLSVGTGGSRVHFSTESAGDYAGSYTPGWVCTKTDAEGTEDIRWPESGSSPTPPPETSTFTLLNAGEFIDCTVTYTPPYLTLEKQVDNGNTDAQNVASDFTLAAVGNTAPNTTLSWTGATAGSQRFPVAVGDYTLTETAPDPEVDGNWQYGYAWSDLTCMQDGGEGLPVETIKEDNGSISEAMVAVDRDQDITCTYTNTALQPHLQIEKTADPLSGELLDPQQEVTYTLTFDNSEGTAGMAVDHVDHLADVLDDADLDEASVEADGLDVEFQDETENPALLITGAVDAGDVSTVEFTVQVKAHDEDFEARQDTSDHLDGYTLNNYLTERLDVNGDPTAAPNECTDSPDGETTTCTEHPISAWTFEKGSFPASGARLNRGGNTHYVLTADKLNEATPLENLTFKDDLTHVFNTAGWAPDASVPGGAKPRGIYFIDANGNTLDADGEQNGTSSDPAEAYGPAAVGEPSLQHGRWILESQQVDVPANAVSAELWFAVEAGQSPVGIPNADEQWQGPNAPQNGWQYVNYGMAQADGNAPAQCGPDTWLGLSPDVYRSPTDADPTDPAIAEACWTRHELNAGHFTIRKDSTGAGIDMPYDPAYGDTDGLWNMVGHEFQIHDDIAGSPSEHPSQYLCRTDYHPDVWDGDFTAHTGDRSLDDWGAETGGSSETLAAIRAHNDQVEDPAEVLPECGLFYAQPEGSGGQTGRYRGENLQPVLDDGQEGTPRDFWLYETKAPTHQISLNGQQQRQVQGVQRLAEPVQFRMWPYQDGTHIEGPAWQGKRQLDIPEGEGYQQRCTPGASVQDRPGVCVNPTGYLMLVQDTVPMRLPLTGGQWTGVLAAVGFVVIVTTLAAGYWKRHRAKKSHVSHDS